MIPNFALIDAIKRDNEGDFKAAIAAGASLSARDFCGASVLEVAERYGSANTARRLFSLGVDANQFVGTTERRLLHRTAIKGDFTFTRMLIASGADVNSKDRHGKRPLHLAVSKGHQYICLDLIDAGAEVNAQTNSGKTALFFAARLEDCTTVKTLLANRADPSLADNHRITPAMEAARLGNTEVAKALIRSIRQGLYSQRIEAERVVKVAESTGHANVAHAIQEEFGIPVGRTQMKLF